MADLPEQKRERSMSPAPHADRDHSESPALTTGMFDTFVRPCLDCGTTVRVVDGKTKAHDCATLPERERVAYAWWQGYDTARAVADAEQAELRAEVEQWKDTTRLAMSALTTSRDVLHAASGLPEGIDDVDVVDETVLALRPRAEAAEAERDRARSLAATLEARLAQVEALAKQAYPVPVSAGGGNLVRHVRVVPIADIFAILHPEGDA